MPRNTNWTREELIVAYNLYCKLPFGRLHNRNPEIISLASLIGRTPSALAWKLSNFARLDPSLQNRGISGATHGSRRDKEIWDEFAHDWERLSFESEELLAQMKGKPIERATNIDISDLPPGMEREAIVRTRVNQGFFRSTILAAYNSKCCITDLAIPELLNASHIVPWAIDPKNRVNPQNGLCLNAIHDRAFDRGLLTITPDYRVKLSPSLKAIQDDEAIENLLFRYDGCEIALPDKFLPDVRFIEYHNQYVFRE
jgi:putative restriction endonuclease